MLEDFRFKKSLGQNFISDINFLNAMVSDAGVTKQDCVLEIGAGAGALTEALAKVAVKVVSVEKDEELKDILNARFEGNNKVKLIFGDFMKLDKATLEKDLTKPYKVVANLPYYITTPIIFKLIEEDFEASSLTIMVQKEVADRLRAKPGTKDYGSITAKINLIANVEIVRAAPRSLFHPQPNVDSSVVNIAFKQGKPKNREIFNRVVNCAFQERRKMFVSNLMREFKLSRQACIEVLQKCGVDTNVRGEVLDATEFAKIAEIIKKL